MDITANKVNEWRQVELRRQIRADRFGEFFGRVRKTFICLFILTVMVFVLNHHVELQGIAYAKLNQAINKSSTAQKIRQKALNDENEVDEVTQQIPQVVSR